MALDCGFTHPPEIENQDADCRINICIDNSIYGIAALPYPVRCPEKAPREMADVVFGQKDDWQEDEDEERDLKSSEMFPRVRAYRYSSRRIVFKSCWVKSRNRL